MFDRPTIRFHTSTGASWDAMLDAIRQAQISIDLEQYIFENDEVGSRFLQAIVKKSQNGVKVRLILDMVGSLSFYLSDLPTLFRENGIEVCFFNPISLWRLHNITSHFFRDHRKILVVDGSVGFVGGVGIADRMHDWRDTTVEVQGEFVKNIAHIFELAWRRVQTGRYRRLKRPSLHKGYKLLTNAPRFRQRFLYHAYIAEMRKAKNYIYLATPYFIPDRRFLRVLRAAADRGVDVRLIVPAVSDTVLVDHIQSYYIGLALRSGIRVYTYASVFYHTKMAIIDDRFATTGSSNLDNLSFLFNHEANIASDDEAFIDALKEHFDRDCAEAKELTYERWKRRFFGRKLLELLVWPLHPVF